MKRYTLLRMSSALLSGWLLLMSCTDNYDSVNLDPSKLLDVGTAEVPFLFSKALSVAPNNQANYQIAQNLFADQYAQYFACSAAYFGSDRLVINQNWVGAAFNPIYTEVVPQLTKIFELTDPSSAEYALANVVWVYAFHRVTDYWGPIPYTQVMKDLPSVPYDPQNEIYHDFFTRLDAAIAVLEGKRSEKPYDTYDIIYGGNVDKWIKFANTLRLRLAMRISNVEPGFAQTEAEKAVAGGVMEESPTDDALVKRSLSGNDGNGLAIMQWNEFRMSASMESVLKGYEDPRMTEYYLPYKKFYGKEPDQYNLAYDGIRNGLTSAQMATKSGINKADSNSQQGPRWSPPEFGGIGSYLATPQNVMCAAEAWFLRAEGKLKGWDMGDGEAVEFYNNGIINSFKQWGITDDPAAYYNSLDTPIPPEDFLNSPAMTNIPVKFSAVRAEQDEQIATQKWLALFPDGTEAWADYRRNHKLKLYPVANSDNPLIKTPATQWLRRMPFLQSERQTNAAAVTAAESLLNGPDDTQTPLWWDVIPRN